MAELTAIGKLLNYIGVAKNMGLRQIDAFALIELIEPLIQKEKEQIINAHYEGACNFQDAMNCKNAEVPYINDAHDYYNETYSNGKKD